jgi:hypothetical protein
VLDCRSDVIDSRTPVIFTNRRLQGPRLASSTGSEPSGCPAFLDLANFLVGIQRAKLCTLGNYRKKLELERQSLEGAFDSHDDYKGVVPLRPDGLDALDQDGKMRQGGHRPPHQEP